MQAVSAPPLAYAFGMSHVEENALTVDFAF